MTTNNNWIKFHDSIQWTTVITTWDINCIYTDDTQLMLYDNKPLPHNFPNFHLTLLLYAYLLTYLFTWMCIGVTVHSFVRLLLSYTFVRACNSTSLFLGLSNNIFIDLQTKQSTTATNNILSVCVYDILWYIVNPIPTNINILRVNVH